MKDQNKKMKIVSIGIQILLFTIVLFFFVPKASAHICDSGDIPDPAPCSELLTVTPDGTYKEGCPSQNPPQGTFCVLKKNTNILYNCQDQTCIGATFEQEGAEALGQNEVPANNETQMRELYFLGAAYLDILVATFADLIKVVGQVLNPIANAQFTADFLAMETIQEMWEVVRDFVNIFYILLLVASSFGIIFRVNNFTAKSVIPKIVLGAILINFSFAITGVVVDLSQLAMESVQDSPRIYGSTGTVMNVDFSAQLLSTFDFTRMKAFPEKPSEFNSINIFKGDLVTLIFLGIILILFSLMVVSFLVRAAGLAFLLAFSPLPFVAITFPPLRKYAKMWWNYMFKLGFYGPVALLFLHFINKTLQLVKDGTVVFQTLKALPSQGSILESVILHDVVSPNFIIMVSMMVLFVALLKFSPLVANLAGEASLTLASDFIVKGQNVFLSQIQDFASKSKTYQQYKEKLKQVPGAIGGRFESTGGPLGFFRGFFGFQSPYPKGPTPKTPFAPSVGNVYPRLKKVDLTSEKIPTSHHQILSRQTPSQKSEEDLMYEQIVAKQNDYLSDRSDSYMNRFAQLSGEKTLSNLEKAEALGAIAASSAKGKLSDLVVNNTVSSTMKEKGHPISGSDIRSSLNALVNVFTEKLPRKLTERFNRSINQKFSSRGDVHLMNFEREKIVPILSEKKERKAQIDREIIAKLDSRELRSVFSKDMFSLQNGKLKSFTEQLIRSGKMFSGENLKNTVLSNKKLFQNLVTPALATKYAKDKNLSEKLQGIREALEEHPSERKTKKKEGKAEFSEEEKEFLKREEMKKKQGKMIFEKFSESENSNVDNLTALVRLAIIDKDTEKALQLFTKDKENELVGGKRESYPEGMLPGAFPWMFAKNLVLQSLELFGYEILSLNESLAEDLENLWIGLDKDGERKVKNEIAGVLYRSSSEISLGKEKYTVQSLMEKYQNISKDASFDALSIEQFVHSLGSKDTSERTVVRNLLQLFKELNRSGVHKTDDEPMKISAQERTVYPKDTLRNDTPIVTEERKAGISKKSIQIPQNEVLKIPERKVASDVVEKNQVLLSSCEKNLSSLLAKYAKMDFYDTMSQSKKGFIHNLEKKVSFAKKFSQKSVESLLGRYRTSDLFKTFSNDKLEFLRGLAG